MARERLITAAGCLVFAVLAVVLWRDYLGHSAKIYDNRDAAQMQIATIDKQLDTVQDADQWAQLNEDRTAAEARFLQANRQINDMDGWNSFEWKVKNSLRLAAPAISVLFAGMTLLSILQPLRPS